MKDIILLTDEEWVDAQNMELYLCECDDPDCEGECEMGNLLVESHISRLEIERTI